ncbi:hypothetical protein IFM61392_01415 [Aspergillus lentulus]|nr:hypothetical protein IFM47457_01136 [Aspergillus lentulus]GFG00510.1 hypothetical protein IFM61392_01415 [Aspergillus lentulus]
MPIYDITHYLPIETLPHPETDKTNYTKPILVLIVSRRVNTWSTYLFLIRKPQREASLNLRHKRYGLNELVDEHADEIAGRPPRPPHHPPQTARILPYLRLRVPPRAAAKYPTSFTAFMQVHFSVKWTIAGQSRQRVAMELQQHIPGMLAARNYRRWFHMRGVCLRGVPRQEKVLVSCEDGEIEFEKGKRMNRWMLETPDTVVGDEDMDEDDGDDEDEEGDEEDEQLRGDCPVAIHEVEPANDTETEELGGSYVAFVGHLEDSRSMAALILGICGVEMDDTE